MSSGVEKQIKENSFLVSKTDTRGIITYCNEPFIEIVAAKGKDIIGKPHNIVRHADMPRIIFKLLWEQVKNKREIFAYVKNKSFDGGYYWVFANVTASLDEHGAVVGYYSVRRAPNPKALEIIKPLYAELLAAEKMGGMDASMKLLQDTLDKQGLSYDEFVNKLQRM